MAPSTRNKPPLTEAEKKKRRQEYDRKRRERMKSDPILLKKLKEKEKEKYQNKLKKKQRKLVKDMSDRERRHQQKLWRTYKKHSKNKKENAATSNGPSPRQVQAFKLLLKKGKETRASDAAKIKHLEEVNKKLKAECEKYRKRDARAKKVSASPATKVKQVMKNGTEKEIVKKLLFSETIGDVLEKGYKSLQNYRDRNKFSNLIVNNAQYFKKYKMMNEFNRISSKLFHMNTEHRSNNSKFRMRVKKLKFQVEADVVKFFEDDDISRLCPGKKDFVVRKNVKRQKRFLLDTLKNCHVKFCKKIGYTISYATFCRLKPFWVVHLKVTDRDTCMCKTHENMDLLVKSLHSAEVIQAASVNELLSSLCCDSSATDCLLRKCESCRLFAITYKEFSGDDPITYQQWTTVRENVPTKKKKKPKVVTNVARIVINSTTFAAVDFLESEVVKFMCHQATTIHQARQFKFLKLRLTEKEVIIHCDFSENYSAKLNTEIQSFHFGGSRKQFTLHTVQVYFKKDAFSPVHSQSICTLSECNEHGPHAVWAHMKPVIDFILKAVPDIETVHFQSDSPSTQYRNKTNFFLLARAFSEMTHIQTVTWNYSAPGHGKGAPDGIGGVLKRTADRAVAEGSDVCDFNSFVTTLQDKTRNVLLHIIHEEDIQRVLTQIPKSLSAFTGTMKVHQIVYHKSSPSVLHMKSLSCFQCLDCEKFLIGTHTISELQSLQSSPEEDKAMDTQIRPKEVEIMGAQSTPDPGRNGERSSSGPDFDPTPHDNLTSLPPVGSYIIALNNQPGSSKTGTTMVCYVKHVFEDHMTVITLEPMENSRRSFLMNMANGARELLNTDVLRVLPSPTVKIVKKQVLRAFPFDIKLF